MFFQGRWTYMSKSTHTCKASGSNFNRLWPNKALESQSGQIRLQVTMLRNQLKHSRWSLHNLNLTSVTCKKRLHLFPYVLRLVKNAHTGHHFVTAQPVTKEAEPLCQKSFSCYLANNYKLPLKNWLVILWFSTISHCTVIFLFSSTCIFLQTLTQTNRVISAVYPTQAVDSSITQTSLDTPEGNSCY